jgi:DNA polymerase-3 subunit beta
MRFTIPAGKLAAVAAITAQLVQPRNRIELLRMIRLMARGGELMLAAHNLDECVTARIETNVTEPGDVLVDAHRVSQLAAALPPSTSIAVTTDDNALWLSAGRARYRLAARPPDDFPPPLTTDPERASEIPLDGNMISRIFHIPMTAAGSEATRDHLMSVHLRPDGDAIAATGADGHRLITVTTPLMGNKGALLGEVIVPRLACERLRRVGGTMMRTDGKIVEFINDERGISYASKLVAGTYPDFRRVIPSPSGNEAEVDRKELIAALTRLDALRNRSEDTRNIIVVAWSDDALSLTLPDTGLRSGVETIEAMTTGESCFGCHAGYLLSMAEAIDGDVIVINAHGGMTTVRFTAPSDAGFLGIAAPMEV